MIGVVLAPARGNMKSITVSICELFFFLMAANLSVVVVADEANAVNDRVTVQLKWVHQIQFAGFYVAQEKGFYASENLDVEFLPGGNTVDIPNVLMDGKADFAVSSPEEIIIRRSRGMPIKAIAAIYRRSAVVFLAMPEAGITRPVDFLGKTVAAAGRHGGASEFEFQLTAMMKNLGLDFSQLTITPYDPAYKGFYDGTVDITGAYSTGGLIKIRQRGYHPMIIWPGDYRVRFYSDTLAALDRMIADHPALVERFLRATLKGWQAAIDDRATTLDAVLKFASIKDRDLQADMFDAMLPLVHTGDNSIGWMEPGVWQEMHKVMVEQGIIHKPLDPVEQLYTTHFLKAIRRNQRP
jgi:NitT/TauT family transport system substrate-binding protein